jgi:hypothetical protein
LKPWDYSKDEFDEASIKNVLVGLTARHRLITSSKLRILNPQRAPDVLPISGLVSFVAPQFADTVREEWDRSRITGDVSSMDHFRRLLARSTVVHDPNAEDQDMLTLATKCLLGESNPSILSTKPQIPERIEDDAFVDDGKMSTSRRSCLQWLGNPNNSWLRYELGSVSFKPVLHSMKSSGMYGFVCEEIVTASSLSNLIPPGQITGNLAYRMAVRCGKSFATEQGLRQHLSSHHAPPGTWLCRTCGVDCVTSQARTHHERTCGQPVSFSTTNDGPPTAGAKIKVGNKKGRPAKVNQAKDEKDADGSYRVPSYRGKFIYLVDGVASYHTRILKSIFNIFLL